MNDLRRQNSRPQQTFERWTPRTQESPRELARQSEAKRKQAPQSEANVCRRRKCNLKKTSLINCTGHPIMHKTPNTTPRTQISLECGLVAKCNAHFIKKISQLKSDIRSCRCKNFSLKQASGRIGGSGPEESDSGQTITAKKPRLNRWIHTKKHRNTSKASLLYLFYRKISKNNDI